ncbi:MAG: hypothetical protein E7675_00760 [Ruminococcaceae bacterium]|nr:hypothetical protein [Oscillospiraceae bacterium]
MRINRVSKAIISLICLVSMILPLAPASLVTSYADDEVNSRKTPIMGWASWNAYRTDITEESILSQAIKLKELGLQELGYVFVNVDDGWQNGRGEDGLVNINTTRFPSGMKALADTLHDMGFYAGIYTDAGSYTCGWASDNEVNNFNVGLYGHDEEDLRRYLIEWGYDFIKVDWCGGIRQGLSKQQRYTAIGNIVKEIEKETGDDKIYNVCCWSFPGEWVTDVADSWRTGGDIFNNFGAVLEQLDNIKSLAKYTTPGHVNDLDMMQVGNGMTYEEDKSHFSMWCMMSTPLMLGMDLNSISDETLSIISNAELIALNQDPACIQATVAKTYGDVEAWTKDLGSADSGKKAIALLNRSNESKTVVVSFEDLGLKNVVKLRDLWSHSDIPVGETYKVTIPAHGTVVLSAEGIDIPLEDEKNDIFVEDGSTPVFEAKLEGKPKLINLTTLGKYDWVHFGDTETTKMRNGSGEIQLSYEGSYCTYGNAAATYSWTNGNGSTPVKTSTSGIGVRGKGAYMLLSTPCDQNERTLYLPIGSYSANIKIELIIGGKVQKSFSVKGGGEQKVDKLLTFTYSSDIPTTAYVKWTVVDSLGSSDSVNVEGVALSMKVTKSSLGNPKIDYNGEELEVSVNAISLSAGASVIFALEDKNGALLEFKTLEVGAKKAQTVKATFNAGKSFEGRVCAYLWKGNVPLCKNTECEVAYASNSDYGIGPMGAKHLVSKGAVLLDVRTPEEYARGHIEGALNLDYSKIATDVEKLVANKEQAVIVYCSAAKRSTQAVEAMIKLGYKNVYNLGSMSNYDVEPTLTFSSKTCKVITAGEGVEVEFTASPFDKPSVYVSIGAGSEFKDAVKIEEFTVPEYDGYYMTLKAYLAYEGVCYAEISEEFIFWSEKTVDTFATDIEWKTATIGWGSIKKDKSVNGNPLTLAGKKFSHGIGTHANSEIVMDIPKGAEKFLAVAGCDLEMSGMNTMMFFVYIDGELVDSSSLIKIGQHYIFDIDIPKGAEEIKLYAYEGTYGGNTNDHADWTVAAFFKDVK